MKLMTLILILLSLQPFSLLAEDFLKGRSEVFYLSHKYTLNKVDKKEKIKKKDKCERVEITIWQIDEIKNLRLWHKDKNPRVKILEETADKIEVFGQKTKNENKLVLEFKGLYANQDLCKNALSSVDEKFSDFIKNNKK